MKFDLNQQKAILSGWEDAGAGGAAFFLGKGGAGPALPVFCMHNLRKMAQGINEWMNEALFNLGFDEVRPLAKIC